VWRGRRRKEKGGEGRRGEGKGGEGRREKGGEGREKGRGLLLPVVLITIYGSTKSGIIYIHK
jgi:hypothetical protein